MNSSLEINESVINNLVKAFTGTTEEVISEIKYEYGMSTGNFKNGGSWDIRFNRIKHAALQNNLVVITRKRGIWTFVCVLNTDNGVMYVFSKDKNLEIVKKNLGKKNIHYFHAFVSLNSDSYDLDNQQMSLFSTLPEEYEEKRLREAQKILGEEYPLVRSVVFVVAKEEERKIVGVEATLYNRYFEPQDVQDWSTHLPSDEYSKIYETDDETIDNTDTAGVIPKIKQNIKDRKKYIEQNISAKKQGEKDFQEEENS
jgi:Family of unknown function (DUF5986)